MRTIVGQAEVRTVLGINVGVFVCESLGMTGLVDVVERGATSWGLNIGWFEGCAEPLVDVKEVLLGVPTVSPASR